MKRKKKRRRSSEQIFSRHRCRVTALRPLQKLLTFRSLLPSCPPPPAPDNKHSSDRQQKAGRRPCAILVTHTPLLRASWTKKPSGSDNGTRDNNSAEDTLGKRRSCPLQGHLPLFSSILVQNRRTHRRHGSATIVATEQTGSSLLTSPQLRQGERWAIGSLPPRSRLLSARLREERR